MDAYSWKRNLYPLWYKGNTGDTNPGVPIVTPSDDIRYQGPTKETSAVVSEQTPEEYGGKGVLTV